jgi:hypothetical protein
LLADHFPQLGGNELLIFRPQCEERVSQLFRRQDGQLPFAAWAPCLRKFCAHLPKILCQRPHEHMGPKLTIDVVGHLHASVLAAITIVELLFEIFSQGDQSGPRLCIDQRISSGVVMLWLLPGAAVGFFAGGGFESTADDRDELRRQGDWICRICNPN